MEAQQTLQELEERVRLLEAILTSVGEGVAVADEEGHFLVFNPAGERMIGMGARDVGPEEWPETYGIFYADEVTPVPTDELPMVRAMRGETMAQVELFLRNENIPEGVFISVTATPLRNERDELKGATCIWRDITAQVRAQQELESQTEKLMQSERLSAIGETVTALAHESRNALQRSQACLTMLAHRVVGDPKAVELVAGIQQAQDDLHRLYEQVRAYAAPLNLDLESTDLPQLLAATWKRLSLNLADRQGTLQQTDGAEDLRCHVDRFAIEQVFRNVLENALAACSDPVEIDAVWSTSGTNTDAFIDVEIRDNGPGLGDVDTERIFEPFYTTRIGGTGLGLAIARRIVATHAGCIEARSRRGGGTAIRIQLPRQRV